LIGGPLRMITKAAADPAKIGGQAAI